MLQNLGLGLNQCLVLIDGILLEWSNLQQNIYRRGVAHITQPRARNITFVPLSFEFSRLGGFFKSFQRLLWYTRTYFDGCFDNGIWTPDARGVYGRSEELRSGLVQLSKMHNMICDALKHLRRGDYDRWWALSRTANLLSDTVAQTYHHRQFPDVLAILLLLERHGQSDTRFRLAKDLHDWATAKPLLSSNDPRRHMFRELTDLPVDSTGDLYLAFDACCRELWMQKVRGDEIVAYYSYNQASLPRAAPGRFYDLYQGKSLDQIKLVLSKVEERFELLDHASICLWHTSIRYLLQELRYDDAEHVCSDLSMRLEGLDMPPANFEQHQLNVDVALTFFLLGSSQHSQGKFLEAIGSFERCVDLRSLIVPENKWDPTLASALERLRDLAQRLGDVETESAVDNRLQSIYSVVEREDVVRQIQNRSKESLQLLEKARKKGLNV